MTDTETSAYHQAQQAQILREKLHEYATQAVQYGNVDRDWVNAWLVRLGVEPVIGTALYRINVSIVGRFGRTIKASTRAEALKIFAQHVARVAAAGQITDGWCDGVYGVQFTDEVPEFFSGPQDPPTDLPEDQPGLEGLRAGIHKMLKQGVAEQGWGHSYAVAALADMGLDPLPELSHRTVSVPVSGTARLSVAVFEGDGDEAVQAAAARVLAAASSVVVTPEEAGEAVVTGSDGMALELLDEDDDEDGSF